MCSPINYSQRQIASDGRLQCKCWCRPQWMGRLYWQTRCRYRQQQWPPPAKYMFRIWLSHHQHLISTEISVQNNMDASQFKTLASARLCYCLTFRPSRCAYKIDIIDMKSQFILLVGYWWMLDVHARYQKYYKYLFIDHIFWHLWTYMTFSGSNTISNFSTKILHWRICLVARHSYSLC